jgi:hypothetical protein
MLIYSLLNPYGVAHPLVTSSQVLGEVVAGLAGGWMSRLGIGRAPMPVRVSVLAATGFVITAFYDALTNLATGVLFGQMRATLMGGVPFALWHMGSNAVLFGALGAPLAGMLETYRSRLSA